MSYPCGRLIFDPKAKTLLACCWTGPKNFNKIPFVHQSYSTFSSGQQTDTCPPIHILRGSFFAFFMSSHNINFSHSICEGQRFQCQTRMLIVVRHWICFCRKRGSLLREGVNVQLLLNHLLQPLLLQLRQCVPTPERVRSAPYPLWKLVWKLVQTKAISSVQWGWSSIRQVGADFINLIFLCHL